MTSGSEKVSQSGGTLRRQGRCLGIIISHTFPQIWDFMILDWQRHGSSKQIWPGSMGYMDSVTIIIGLTVTF